MSFLINPYMQTTGLATTYAFTVPGRDAESGAADWTNIYGGPVSLATASTRGFAGEYCFAGAANAAYTRARHVWYNIPSEYFATSDAGLLTATLTLLYGTINSDADRGSFTMEYWSGADGTGTLLGYDAQPFGSLTSDTVVTSTIVGKIPAGTRSFSFSVLAIRQGGAELSFYFEIVSLTLGIGTEHRSACLFSDYAESSSASMQAGWTVTSGAIASTTAISGSDIWDFWQRYGGSQAALAYNKAVTIPPLALAAIPSGNAVARLKRAAWNTNASDKSRTWCEFLDASANVVATLQDTAAPATWTTVATLAEYTIALPANAVSARMGFQFARSDGTVLDARVAMTEVSIEWPGVDAVETTTLSPHWKNSGLTLSNGDLTIASGAASAFRSALSLDAKLAEKWYFEAKVDAIGAGSSFTNILVGVSNTRSTINAETLAAGEVAFADQWSGVNGIIYTAGQGGATGGTAFGSAWAVGDIISVAVDADARTVKFRRNGGTWSADYTIGGTQPITPMIAIYEINTQITLNFGASAFAYSPPAGYSVWRKNTSYKGRYWRRQTWSGTGSGQNIAEIAMRLGVGGTGSIIAGGTASASSVYTTFVASRAIDGNITTFWGSNGEQNTAWWQYDFGAGNSPEIREVSETVRNDSANQYMLAGGYVYSDDGATWFPAGGFDGLVWTNGSAKTFAVGGA